MLSFPNIELYEEATFFGGSFHPWHQGHNACIKSFPQNQKLYIVPDFNPEKEITERPNLVELMRVTGRPADDFYMGFIEEKKKNPTYYWIKQLKEEHPLLRLNLLLGADSFIRLKSWIEGEKLVKTLSGVYVVPRMVAESLLNQTEKELKQLNADLKVVMLPHHAYEDLSSTNIRFNKK